MSIDVSQLPQTGTTGDPMTETVPTRIQLALNVEDIDAAVAFYSAMLGAEPVKRRPGYANFAIVSPPLKLVLIENKGAAERLNHLGVEMASVDDVDAAQTRLGEAGLVSTDERDSTCCYAKQDKFWVEGSPDGERWEFYTVLADSPTFFAEVASPAASDTCCGAPAVAGAAAAPTQTACC
jgi:catechol 2,3-dioxygenase-like lactoylglutathione lyase family enzyme